MLRRVKGEDDVRHQMAADVFGIHQRRIYLLAYDSDGHG